MQGKKTLFSTSLVTKFLSHQQVAKKNFKAESFSCTQLKYLLSLDLTLLLNIFFIIIIYYYITIYLALLSLKPTVFHISVVECLGILKKLI